MVSAFPSATFMIRFRNCKDLASDPNLAAPGKLVLSCPERRLSPLPPGGLRREKEQDVCLWALKGLSLLNRDAVMPRVL